MLQSWNQIDRRGDLVEIFDDGRIVFVPSVRPIDIWLLGRDRKRGAVQKRHSGMKDGLVPERIAQNIGAFARQFTSSKQKGAMTMGITPFAEAFEDSHSSMRWQWSAR
jgi:hypothetical protein